VAGAFFMENLDGTVIATAMPQMANSFGVRPPDLHIGMTVYMLALAVFIPISGWVADRFGARRTFTSAIALFTFASILCGISHSLPLFTAARVLQGIGGAMMVPVGRLVVLRVTEKKDLIHAIATLTWPGLIAPLIAPPLGGFITAYANWRWIFFLNIPLGILAFVLSRLWIREEKRPEPPPLDRWTFLFCAIGCTAFICGLETMRLPRIPWVQTLLLAALSLLMAFMAVRATRRAAFPIIDLESMKLKTFASTVMGGSVFRVAISVAPFLLPLMFQTAFGLDAFQAGLLVLALFAGNVAMKPLTTPILKRFGFRNVLIVNGVITALAMAACALLQPGTPRVFILALLFLNGLCRSLQFTAIATLTFVDVPAERMSSANSFSSLAHRLSMGLGVAAGALALQLGYALKGQGVAAFHVAFILSAVLAIVGILDSFKLPLDAGSVTSGHRPRRAEPTS